MLKNQTTKRTFCDFVPSPKRWWNEENPCQYVSHKIWSSSSFFNIQNTYISIRDKNRFPKKTLVSTLVSFNPRNVLLVFRLILVHGKITHPDSADEVLDLFFKGETPPTFRRMATETSALNWKYIPWFYPKKTRRCETSPRLCALP